MRRFIFASLMLALVPATTISAQETPAPPMAPSPAASATAFPSAPSGGVTASQAQALDTIGRLSVAGSAAPGVTIAVERNGTIVYVKGFGYRNVEDGVPALADTRYPIGSNTKQFTSASILLLQEEGKLNINDKLSTYLPEIPHGNQVTLRNLLTHAGGYAEFTALGDFDEIGNRAATLGQVVAHVDAKPLSFTPGTKREYSNTGYELLTMVIERVSKMTYAQFLQQHIFTPLGMTHTYVRSFDDTFPNVATEYSSYWLGPWEHAGHIDYTWFGGAGAIISNVQDMLKWNAGLAGGKVISGRSFREMTTPITLGASFPGYGFGIMKTKLANGHLMIAHGGNTMGAASQDARFPDDHLSIVVLSNSGAFDYNAAVAAIYDVMVPPAAKKASTQPAASLNGTGPKGNPAQIAAAKKWLDDAIAGHIDMQRLRPELASHFLAPSRRVAIRALAKLGARKYTLVDVDRRPPATGYIFLLTTPKKSLLYAYSVDDSGQVAGAETIDTVAYPKAHR